MAKIAVIGPGAIGGTLTAWLSQNPAHDVSVAVRTRFDQLEIETPSGWITAKPKILTSPEQATPVDWILVTTKTYDANNTVPWLNGLRHDKTQVAVIQNGVEHVERFAPFLPVEKILPVMIDCPAERTAPGRIRQRANARMVVPAGTAGESFVQLFVHTSFELTQNTDFKTQIWKKLCINSAGALSGIVMKPAGISHHDGVAEIMRGIVRECIAVGRAEGARLNDSLADSVIASYRSSPPDSINSLHADRIAGRRMEIDARNGVLVRLGRKHDIPTPLNAMIVALLEVAQA